MPFVVKKIITTKAQRTQRKHFLDENGNIAAEMNNSGRKMASFLAMIIDHSTSQQEEEMTDIDLRCNKRGCHGAILAEVNRSENTIYWGCTDCDHDGMISEWKGSKWDNTPDSGK